MSGSSTFICYRRSDSAMYTRKLYDDLVDEFGDDDVFMDLPRKILGEDFRVRIARNVGSCSVLLVVIGPDWLHATDEDGRRRLDDDSDLVRIEIETGLERGDVVVIPLFVRGAQPPKPGSLPPSLVQLSQLDGQALREEDWDEDVAKVVARVREVRGRRLHGRVPTVALIAGIVLVSLASVAVAAALSGGGGGSSPPAVAIGALYALQGANAGSSRDSLNGVKFAIDYINNARYPDLGLPLRPGRGLPALGGAKLDLKVQDVGRDRCNARPEFERLVHGRGAVAVIGAYESTITLQAIYAANQLNVPLVNDTSTATLLTKQDGQADPPPNPCGPSSEDPTPSPWFTRVGSTDAQFATLFKGFIEEQRREGRIIHTAAILYESNDLFGAGVQSDTARLARGLGMTLRKYPYPSQFSSDPGTPSHGCANRSLVDAIGRRVKEIADDPPDVVFAASYLADAVIAVQTMKTIGYRPPALLAYGAGYADARFMAAVKKPNPGCDLPATDPSGIITRAVGWTQIRGRQADRAAALFRQRYGVAMTDTAARAFTATMALAQSINAAGSTKPEQIQAELRSLNVSSKQTILPRNAIAIDDYGQNRAARGVLLQILDGEYKVVYPPRIATANAVWPLADASR